MVKWQYREADKERDISVNEGYDSDYDHIFNVEKYLLKIIKYQLLFIFVVTYHSWEPFILSVHEITVILIHVSTDSQSNR